MRCAEKKKSFWPFAKKRRTENDASAVALVMRTGTVKRDEKVAMYRGNYSNSFSGILISDVCHEDCLCHLFMPLLSVMCCCCLKALCLYINDVKDDKGDLSTCLRQNH